MKSGWIDRTVITGFVMSFLGVGFLIFGVVSSFGTISFLDEAERAEGTVTNLEERREQRGSRFRTATYASIDFTTQDGNPVEIEVETGWNLRVGQVGENVEVLYLENAPEDARVNSFLGIWEGSVYGIVGAVFLLIVSAIAIVPAWKRRQRSPQAFPPPPPV